MSVFQIGQRVRVNSPGSMIHGDTGVVVRANYSTGGPDWVRVDFGNEYEHEVPMRAGELVLIGSSKKHHTPPMFPATAAGHATGAGDGGAK